MDLKIKGQSSKFINGTCGITEFTIISHISLKDTGSASFLSVWKLYENKFCKDLYKKNRFHHHLYDRFQAMCRDQDFPWLWDYHLFDVSSRIKMLVIYRLLLLCKILCIECTCQKNLSQRFVQNVYNKYIILIFKYCNVVIWYFIAISSISYIYLYHTIVSFYFYHFLYFFNFIIIYHIISYHIVSLL